MVLRIGEVHHRQESLEREIAIEFAGPSQMHGAPVGIAEHSMACRKGMRAAGIPAALPS